MKPYNENRGLPTSSSTPAGVLLRDSKEHTRFLHQLSRTPAEPGASTYQAGAAAACPRC